LNVKALLDGQIDVALRRYRNPPMPRAASTCKMNDIDPQAWLADVLNRLPDHPANKLVDLLPWNWRPARQQNAVAA
jgi:hypothetical protein